MKMYILKAGLLGAAISIVLGTGACGKTALGPSAGEPSSEDSKEQPEDQKQQAEEALPADRELAEYIALVESYMEGQTFRSVKDERAEELEESLGGHYDVTGRIGHGNRAYYVGLRRQDAPVYDDFVELSTAWVDNASWDKGMNQIGYYDKEGDETILYQITDFSVEALGDRSSADSLNRLCFLPQGISEDQEFIWAFSDGGRLQLDFMKKHPGLSFHREGEPSIEFLYQDEDTLKFWSEPYPCRISLNDKDCEVLRAYLAREQDEDNDKAPKNYGEALEMSREKDPSIRTTGAEFYLDGRTYELLGSRECPGYVLAYEGTGASGEEVSLEHRPEVYSYIIEKIKDTTSIDYGGFTDTWFQVPLVSATLEFPRFDSGGRRVKTQTVEKKEELAALSLLLDKAIRGHEALSACPYMGILELVREDGETLRIYVAADSCDSMTYEGRIGFEYGSQEELARIFHEAMKE